MYMVMWENNTSRGAIRLSWYEFYERPNNQMADKFVLRNILHSCEATIGHLPFSYQEKKE